MAGTHAVLTSGGAPGRILGDLRGRTLAMLDETLLRPPPWVPTSSPPDRLTRNVAAALLDVLRAQIGPLLGWPAPSPWLLLPRLALVVFAGLSRNTVRKYLRHPGVSRAKRRVSKGS